MNSLWHSAVKAVSRYVVKIETPSGHGTGVQFGYNKTRSLVAIGTAEHVVSDVERWRLPMRISTNGQLNSPVYVEPGQCVIFTDARRDSATILVPAKLLSFPDEPLPLQAMDKYRSVGTPVGWVGYPGIAPHTLCFFRGYLSAWQASTDSYLVDGVAIHGVSGGPMFDEDNKPTLLGVVSAYIPNRQQNATLPGLLQAQDLTAMHTHMQTIRTLEEAREKKQAEEAAKPEPPPMQSVLSAVGLEPPPPTSPPGDDS